MFVPKFEDFLSIDWSLVQYDSFGTALLAGSIILFFLGLKILRFLLGRSKFTRVYSGGDVRKYREHWLFGFLYFIPKGLLMIAMFPLVLSLARPYTTNINIETKSLDAKEKFYLIDGSSSMSVGMDSGGSRADVARKAFLKFLRGRNKKELSCLWIFSDNAYRVQGCTVDGYAFRFKVFMSPLFLSIAGEGGTNIGGGIKEVISYVDYKAKRNKKTILVKRSLLIITDAEITTYPADEFELLRQKKIVPYLLWVRGTGSVASGETEKLFSGINRLGGKVFEVGEEKAALKAFHEFDLLEGSSKVETKKNPVKIPLYQKLLEVALFFIFVALISNFILEIFLGDRIR